MHREAADVDFVDDGVLHRRDERHILAPLEMPAHVETAAMGAARVGGAVEVMPVDAPANAVGNCGAARIQQDQLGIEKRWPSPAGPLTWQP